MPLEYTCPHCGHRYQQISRQLAGKKVRCRCGRTGRLPGPRPRQPDNATEDADRQDRLLINDDFSDLDRLLNEE